MLPEEPPIPGSGPGLGPRHRLVRSCLRSLCLELNAPLLPVYCRRHRRRRLSDHDSGTCETSGSGLEELLGAVREQNQVPLKGAGLLTD